MINLRFIKIMPAKTIDGKKLASQIEDNIVKEIVALNDGQVGGAQKRPNLAIILVGEREDSAMYVHMKEREAKRVGIDTHLYKCGPDIPEHQLFEMISALNNDDLVDAILVQLPLPEGFDTDGIIYAIDHKKDVDCFHPHNTEKLIKTCSDDPLLPPVFGVVFAMLQHIKFDLLEKKVCIISNTPVFGATLASVMKCRGAEARFARPDDKNLKSKTLKADVLISAAGRRKLITADMVKADAVVIDVGINRNDENQVCGDVDFEEVKKKASYITPVPGGVGPMTIAMLFQNTLKLYKNRHK